jgi:SNF2 family DNA or RNA helicase
MKKPYPFQQYAIDTITTSPNTGFLLADECGLGKSITALEIAKFTQRADQPNWKCLIICPPTLMLQWWSFILEQDPGRPVLMSARLPRDYENYSGYVITSIYEVLDIPTWSSIVCYYWDMLILDEAHRIKNRATKTARAIKLAVAGRRLALTGTPMEKSPSDLWSILNFLDPDHWRGYWGFVAQHLEKHREGYGSFQHWVIGGPREPDLFGLAMKPWMLRRSKEDVAPELPEKILIPVTVQMGPEQQSAYDALRKSKDILVAIGDKELVIPSALALITRLQQLSVYPRLIGINAGSAKLDWLEEFLKDHSDEPTVVFTRFRDVAETIAHSYGAELIVGGMKSKVPAPCALLVGTIDAMGEGLNLGWAKHAVFVDCHWSATKMTQAIDRVHRIDAREPKNIYLLSASPVDNLVIQAGERKWTEIELVYYFLNQYASS